MPRALLVSVVEDEHFFRESMRRLMRLNFPVEVFSCAADFLASPHLSRTTCLIADLQMPGMSGLALHKSLVDAGRAIPTLLVSAYPNDIDRDRALDDDSFIILGSQVMKHS
jgi:FixJ family two-component response regulator